MKNYYIFFLLLLLALIFVKCSDPLAVDAEREKAVKWDPDSIPPLFEVVPKILNLGLILPDDSSSYPFYIKNITTKDVPINSITLKNNPNFAIFKMPQSPVILKPKSNSGDKIDVQLDFRALSIGYFYDTLEIEGYKNPKVVVKAEIPAVFARDIDFLDFKVDELTLKILKIHNRSNERVTITEFKINDPEYVFLNEPQFHTPYVLNPYSESDDIKITFSPNKVADFVKEISIKAVFDNPAANKLYPIDTVVVLKGRGVN